MFDLTTLIPCDRVLWYPDPTNPQSPVMGFVASPPGSQTVNILVYAPATGFVEKQSVRHKDDPFWKNSDTAQSWWQWGCFELHPETVMLRELKSLLTTVKAQKAREPAKSAA